MKFKQSETEGKYLFATEAVSFVYENEEIPCDSSKDALK